MGDICPVAGPIRLALWSERGRPCRYLFFSWRCVRNDQAIDSAAEGAEEW